MANNLTTPALPYAEIETLCATGAPVHAIAAHFGIPIDKWYRLIQKDRQLKAAYEKGTSRNHIALAIKLNNSNSPHVLIFRAKAVLGMREQPTQLELSGPNGSAIKSETKSDERSALAEANELLASLTAAARTRVEEPAPVVEDSAGETDSS